MKVSTLILAPYHLETKPGEQKMAAHNKVHAASPISIFEN